MRARHFLGGWWLAAGVAPAATAETMVVTATRAEQPLLDYPGNLSRLEGDEIELIGATHHSELLNRLPGVFIQRGSGQESLMALRSPVLTGAGSCGAFLVLEEGIPLRPVGLCNVNQLFEANTEQAAAIEVMRGPGPAWYGSGAVHGIVNVLLPRPDRLPAFGTTLEGGGEGYARLRAATAGARGATRWALLAHATRDGGFRADSGFDEQKMNVVIERGAALRAWASLTHLDQDTAGFITGEDAFRNRAARESNLNPEAYRQARSARLGLFWRTPLGWDLRAAARSSRMDFLQHFLPGQPLERNGQDSVVLLAARAWPLGAGRLTVGVDGELSRSALEQFQPGPTQTGVPAIDTIRPPGRHYDFRVEGAVAAAHLQWMQPLSAAFELHAALRSEQVRYDYDNRMLAGNTDENGVPCPGGGCLYRRPTDRTDRFTQLTPRLGVLWAYAPTHRMYANIARGYRAPEVSELYRLQREQAVAELSAERSAAAEWGLRGETERLRYDLTAFLMTKSDAILRDAQGFNVNGGRTRHRGIELELDWRLTPTLALGAAGSWARHTYAFSRALEGGELIRAGNAVDTAPRLLYTLHARWQPHPRLQAQAQWQHVGDYFLDPANLHRYGGHALLNLYASWRLAPQWQVRARLTNVLQAAYADRADFAFGRHRYFPGRDRTAVLELAYASRASHGRPPPLSSARSPRHSASAGAGPRPPWPDNGARADPRSPPPPGALRW